MVSSIFNIASSYFYRNIIARKSNCFLINIIRIIASAITVITFYWKNTCIRRTGKTIYLSETVEACMHPWKKILAPQDTHRMIIS